MSLKTTFDAFILKLGNRLQNSDDATVITQEQLDEDFAKITVLGLPAADNFRAVLLPNGLINVIHPKGLRYEIARCTWEDRLKTLARYIPVAVMVAKILPDAMISAPPFDMPRFDFIDKKLNIKVRLWVQTEAATDDDTGEPISQEELSQRFAEKKVKDAINGGFLTLEPDDWFVMLQASRLDEKLSHEERDRVRMRTKMCDRFTGLRRYEILRQLLLESLHENAALLREKAARLEDTFTYVEAR